MYGRLQADNFFVTTLIGGQTLVPGVDGVLRVAELPNIEPGKIFYVVLNVDDIENRFTLPVYIDGDKIKYKGYNVKSIAELKPHDTVSLNDVAENFNYLFKNVDDIGTIVSKGGLDILVYGGVIVRGGVSIEIADTTITLTDNATQYIVFDYSDSTLKAVDVLDDLSNCCFAEITTLGGEITNIDIKKSFNGGEMFSDTYFERNELTGEIQIKEGSISKTNIDLTTLTSDDVTEGTENKYFIGSVYDPNNIHNDVFNMDNMQEGTNKGSVIKSATAPTSPTKGMIWYDTTNDVLKAYDGTNWNPVNTDTTYTASDFDIKDLSDTTSKMQSWDNKQNALTPGTGIDITNDTISVDNTVAKSSDVNTKTFYLSSTSDTTNAQAAYNWYANGKNPLINYNNYIYVLANATATELTFRGKIEQENQNSSSFMKQNILEINVSSDVVTSVTTDVVVVGGSYLRLGQNYSIPYTPTNNGDPASKKYVDENGPYIPVYYHNGFTNDITFSVAKGGVYRICVKGYHGTTINRTITIAVNDTSVSTYVSNLIEHYDYIAEITVATGDTIKVSLDNTTNFSATDIFVDKINAQSGYLTATIN